MAKMAKLKVVFPHDDENGERFMAGDVREVPVHLVDYYTRPLLPMGVVCMVIDPEFWAPEPGELEAEDGHVWVAPEVLEIEQPPVNVLAAGDEIAPDEAEDPKPAKKAKK